MRVVALDGRIFVSPIRRISKILPVAIGTSLGGTNNRDRFSGRFFKLLDCLRGRKRFDSFGGFDSCKTFARCDIEILADLKNKFRSAARFVDEFIEGCLGHSYLEGSFRLTNIFFLSNFLKYSARLLFMFSFYHFRYSPPNNQSVDFYDYLGYKTCMNTIHNAIQKAGTQKKLANICNVSQGAVSKWATGKTCPSPSAVAFILRTLGVDLRHLRPEVFAPIPSSVFLPAPEDEEKCAGNFAKGSEDAPHTL